LKNIITDDLPREYFKGSKNGPPEQVMVRTAYLSTESAKKVNKSAAKNIFSKFNVRCISTSQKENVMSRLEAFIKCGGNVRRDLTIGVNAVSRLVETGCASAVCLTRDSPQNLFVYLVEACVVREVPVLLLPSSSKALADMFSLKKASCFGIRNVCFEAVKVTGTIESSIVSARLDALRDYILEMSTNT